ncbi:MAG: hypothetical protein JST51_10725 [Armatimonadetes bacterium]|nr:hypothetical protein [Armatimonadota bacterium]
MLASLLLASTFVKHGAVVLVGDAIAPSAVFDSFAEQIGGRHAPVLVFEQAEAKPDAMDRQLADAGFDRVTVVSDTTFSSDRRAEVAKMLSEARGVWVPDGDANLFLKRLGPEWCRRVFPAFIERGGAWCGLRAGAALAGDFRLDGENGVGVLDGIVDYDHFVGHHELRLRKTYFTTKVQLGIGLDPGEWVVVRDSVIEKKIGQPWVFLREAG